MLVILNGLPGWAYVLIVPVFLILGLLVVALIIRIIKVSKMCKKPAIVLDESRKKELEDAYGGSDNIESVKLDMSRVTVNVKDVSLINGEAIKQLGAINVLITGNSVKSSFADKSEEVYKLLGGKNE